ncbi:hypothetical protein HDU92_004206 [Lobulomyces angularis]|nr:hypothetical protein HDU92_004206 [Lobulomyces angularis]
MRDYEKPGHIENLSTEQSQTLKSFYIKFFKALQYDSNLEGKVDPKTQSKSTWGFSWSSTKAAEEEEIKDVLPQKAFEDDYVSWSKALHVLFLFCAYDNPDAICLRFVRARKWDVNKATDMMMKALVWREQYNVKDLLKDAEKLVDVKELKAGKGYLLDYDKQGRVICYLHVARHFPAETDLKMIERYSVLTVENGRLMLGEGREQTTLVFDLTGFSLKNMDYAYVKFLLSCFEAYYPESLGLILILNAPSVFNGCFMMIKGWLDPVVASKIKFVSSKEICSYIDKSKLPGVILKHLKTSGEEVEEEELSKAFVYEYNEASEEEVEKLEKLRSDKEREDKVFDDFKKCGLDFYKVTEQWAKSEMEDKSLTEKRELAIMKLRESYKELVPFVRSKSHYHRNIKYKVFDGGFDVL